jgi:hypothetical protein
VKRFFEMKGDHSTAAAIDTIIADEVAHARFGNEWLQRLVKAEPRAVLKIAEAMAFVKHAAKTLATQPGELVVDGKDLSEVKHDIPVHPDERRLAGFSDGEIAEIHRRDAAHTAAEAAKGGGNA